MRSRAELPQALKLTFEVHTVVAPVATCMGGWAADPKVTVQSPNFSVHHVFDVLNNFLTVSLSKFFVIASYANVDTARGILKPR